MGWVGLSDTKTMPKHLRTLVQKACYVDGTDPARIVASSSRGTMRNGEVYIALRMNDGTVIGLVLLIEKSMVKGMTEDMGPYYYNASAEVLDALTPTTSESALEWRATCRTILERNPLLGTEKEVQA